jgi:hypothetical protein
MAFADVQLAYRFHRRSVIMGKLDDFIEKAEKAVGKTVGAVAKKAGALEEAAAKRLHKAVTGVSERAREWEERLGAPHLIRRDDPGLSPAEFTLYLTIKRGRFVQTKTGVYVPPKIPPQGKVNVIIYLHGNKLRVVKSTDTIEEYWGKDRGEKTKSLVFPLREDLRDSGQPYILIGPTLGAQDQGIGEIGSNLDFYLEQIMLALLAYGGFKELPQVGDIIIAGHSGAGGQMIQLAGGTTSYKSNIKEIWGFDTLLDGTEPTWRTWGLAKSGQAKMYVYYWAYEAESLKLAGNTSGVNSVYVLKGDSKAIATADAGAAHDFLLKRHFRERLNNIGRASQDDLKGQAASRAEAKKRK